MDNKRQNHSRTHEVRSDTFSSVAIFPGLVSVVGVQPMQSSLGRRFEYMAIMAQKGFVAPSTEKYIWLCCAKRQAEGDVKDNCSWQRQPASHGPARSPRQHRQRWLVAATVMAITYSNTVSPIAASGDSRRTLGLFLILPRTTLGYVNCRCARSTPRVFTAVN